MATPRFPVIICVDRMASIVPIPIEPFNLGFIGAGKMAESIARGVVKSDVLAASQIRTAHLGTSRRTAFESFGVKVLSQNIEVVKESDVVVFSVKPQVVKDVLLQLKPHFSEKQLLVSVAAGVKLKDLQEWAGHDRFIRVMPNTPAAVGVAASVISLGSAATKEDGELISKLFGAIGKVLGAASMAANVGKHPAQLKDDVASPGGTTIAGIHELEKSGFRGNLMNAVVAAAKRSRELSQS
ncbi:pyrroline-5-carboxylate reductase [Phtheirospermum japonicum]|uniref:Pyrroline-5-carboxylate reductase n=1 Tax=Phtheirospermum japonicum TaxID=374723 RepID=A0A830CF05_9LAMI|nr:pyrroline-5-carboxylate reductase [Phtheirospermum japonicum]